VQLLGNPHDQPCVYVCNHRSYVDIPLLAGALGASFMSRADISAWPVIGAAARAIDVVFIERDDLYGRVAAARALRRRVDTASVVVFPEGTTCGAGLPGVFQPGLFRLLHHMDIAAVPVTIRYSDRRAYWVDDITMSEHMSRFLRGPRIEVAVHVGDRLVPRAYPDSVALGDAIYRSVCRPIEEFGEMVSP
jgi:1-acyl-sn-glycerol-3-phosphate acyltransferase